VLSVQAITANDVAAMLDRYGYSQEICQLIEDEHLLPAGLLNRLQVTYPQHSAFLEAKPFRFYGAEHYEGLSGFRRVTATLAEHGIHLDNLPARELFAQIYRFKASRHVLNSIDWNNYEADPVYQLVFPQPGMLRRELVDKYVAASSDQERQQVIDDYMHETNPHDGHQLLNKPWIENADGGIDILEGSQHKYPQCQLVFDRTTQTCFSFCTYCFRHAQVRGDEDMFIQDDITQVHDYLKLHKEVTDLLITGGDAGYLPYERLKRYVLPILEDPELFHVRTVRLGSRMLTFQPERVLYRSYDKVLELFDLMHENGVQLSWMAHFSTPRELLNPSTIAAIRRLQNHHVVIRSQSPIMNHVSMFTDSSGKVDVERSAQNWIDLANILGTLLVRFHSMYCARVTGEHHYFAAPLAEIEKVANLVYRSLPSTNRPSRYITMTTSAGKLAILGLAEVNGQKAFALKFNEARNMAWMDRVFLARFDEKENRVDFLEPLDTREFFFEEELREIEQRLVELHTNRGAGH
jgi:L-lysine 2,3-aminomutase